MINLGMQRTQTCEGVSRRSFLRVGALSCFGLTLPRLLEARAASSPKRDVNCIVLWMGGGASNIDTFDMKPEAPSEIRGEFKPIATNVSGLQICEHLPKMAKHMDKVCLLRSVTHTESGDHTSAHHYILTGYPLRPDPAGQPVNALIYPSYGSVVSRERGWKNAMPPYVVLAPSKGSNPYHGAGYFGSAYSPLTIRENPADAKFAVPDVSIPASIGAERTERRRGMLAELDHWQRRADRAGELGERRQFYQQAYDLVTSPAAKKAFRLEEESAKVRDRYGRHQHGQSCLLARRLVEAGVRFVTVETNWWDTHVDNFHSLKTSRLPNLDEFYSALLEDLAERGMLENTLVVWMGEFGRTPRINGQAGRDHWAPANVIALSGAGIKPGTIVGQTDKNCERPAGTAHTTHDFAATMYHLLGIDATKEFRTPDGRPVLLNYHGTPIAGVLA